MFYHCFAACANEEMTCMLKSQHEEQYVIDVKDCYNAPDHLKMVGCLKITSDMPGGVSIYFSSIRVKIIFRENLKYCSG